MPSVSSVSPLPTLSQLESWDTEHLTTAASHCTNTAAGWEATFDDINRRMAMPAGAPWGGVAAEAAMQRALADRMVAIGAADQLHAVAQVARLGAMDIAFAKTQVLAAVNHATEAGFTVAEDLSVSHPGPLTVGTAVAIQAQAQSHAAEIRSRAAELTALDRKLADQINTAASAVAKTSFGVEPLSFGPNDLPQSPADALGVHDAEDVHRIVDPLPPGANKGVKVVATPAEIRGLFGILTENAVPAPPSTYPGDRMMLPDGTIIGYRPNSGWGGPTLDILNPDGSKMWDVHLAEKPKLPMPEPLPAPAPAPVPAPAPSPIAIPSPDAPGLPDFGTPSLPPPEDPGIIGGIGVLILGGLWEAGKWVFSP
ncbi:hypothetical protein [Mycolicibacterium vinylchloridicum]|uniref:hypothetical protein n=1 Tax=Mycolicibacterium vinylchloridicum TaxID=2736928 RepID=UPI0015C9C043|nr:hypothetical protein [Mycolicibacterium vinylchloridicum]